MTLYWLVDWFRRRRNRPRRHAPDTGTPGYNVYLVAGTPAGIDLAEPLARLPAEQGCEITTLQADTHYTAAVAARSRFGLLSSVQTIEFDTDAIGNPQLTPASPQQLRARALPGGDVELTWLDPADGAMPAAFFLLHWDGGSGQVNYGGFFGSAPATGRRQCYRRVHSPGMEGRLRYSVRAHAAAGNHDGNTVIAECIADATGPPATTQTPSLTQI